MADIAWLAPKPHKNIGGSGHKLVPDRSLQIAFSRSGSAISLHDAETDQRISYGQPSKTALNEAGWRPQKPPKSAVKGAWQHQGQSKQTNLRANGGLRSRPGSARSEFDMLGIGNSRPSSAKSQRDDDASVAVYKQIKQHRGQSPNDRSRLELEAATLGSRSVHSRPNSAGYRLLPTYVDGADSVNRGLEGEIDQLQGSLFGDQRSHDNFILVNEFLAIEIQYVLINI